MTESPELYLQLAHILHKKGALIWKLRLKEICCQDVDVDMLATHGQPNS